MLDFDVEGQPTMEQKTNAQLEFNLEDLGFPEEATETKALVLHKVLRDLCIPFKKFYSKKSDRSFKRVKKTNIEPSDLTLKFLVECDKAHLQYVSHVYKKRMKEVIALEKCFSLDTEE